MAYYPVVGDNSIYNRSTFNTAYLDTTEIDINNLKTVIEDNKESFTTRVINSLDVKTISINDQTFPAETIEQITINKDDIVDINNDLTEFKNDASIVKLTVTGDASFNTDVSFTENVDIEGILQIQDRDVLEELTGINGRVEKLESGGDNLNVLGTLDVTGKIVTDNIEALNPPMNFKSEAVQEVDTNIFIGVDVNNNFTAIPTSGGVFNNNIWSLSEGNHINLVGQVFTENSVSISMYLKINTWIETGNDIIISFQDLDIGYTNGDLVIHRDGVKGGVVDGIHNYDMRISTTSSEGFAWTEVWRVIPSDSSWVHLVINISQTEGIVVYKNGVLGYRVNKGNLIGVSSGYPIVQVKDFNYQRVGKGTTSTNIHSSIVDGEIKNLRIYNKPLTEVEVNDIYSTIDTIVDSTLVNGNSDLFYFYNGSNLVSYLSSNGNWKSTGSFVGDSDDRIKSYEVDIGDET